MSLLQELEEGRMSTETGESRAIDAHFNLLDVAEEMAAAINEQVAYGCACEGVTGGKLCGLHTALQAWEWWRRDHPVASRRARRVVDVVPSL